MGDERGGRTDDDGSRSRRRRSVLIGGGAALAAVAAGAVAERDALRRWWWRSPLADRGRPPGTVDIPGAESVPASPSNYRLAHRPDDWAVDRVVIHVTQGSFEGALRHFQDPAAKVSAHYVVRSRDGHLAQSVREADIAYHAGGGVWNPRSIGIEHEGYVDRPRYFTEAMYRTSARVTARVCARYGIPVDREHIIGHDQVPTSDHTDPGPHWEWDHYLSLVRAAAA